MLPEPICLVSVLRPDACTSTISLWASHHKLKVNSLESFEFFQNYRARRLTRNMQLSQTPQCDLSDPVKSFQELSLSASKWSSRNEKLKV